MKGLAAADAYREHHLVEKRGEQLAATIRECGGGTGLVEHDGAFGKEAKGVREQYRIGSVEPITDVVHCPCCRWDEKSIERKCVSRPDGCVQREAGWGSQALEQHQSRVRREHQLASFRSSTNRHTLDHR